MKVTLEDIVRRYVHLRSQNKLGWWPCVHLNCDHGKKGPRAAFKFEGEVVEFNCFNCGSHHSHDPDDPTYGKRISKKLRKVLHDFNIPDEELREYELSLFMQDKDGRRAELKRKQYEIEPKPVDCPKHFYFLKNADPDDKWAQVATAYLKHERGVDPDSYPFMLSNAPINGPNKAWLRRVIIPVYKDDKLIYYFGRALDDKLELKYKNPSFERTATMYGYDKLFVNTDLPLYILEGWFDAYLVDGVAIFSNMITPEQRIWLDRSPRKKVYVPDRVGDGDRGARQALSFGWSISTPDIGYSCKDVTDAVLRYGLMYTLRTLKENTHDDLDIAETMLDLFVEK